MNKDQFKLLTETIAHQFSMSFAGFSTIAGLLIAGQKSAELGRSLSPEEHASALDEGGQLVSDAYLAAVRARAEHALSLKDDDSNMQ